MPLPNIKLVALGSDPNSWMGFVSGPGVGSQEAEEHSCDTGGWW